MEHKLADLTKKKKFSPKRFFPNPPDDASVEFACGWGSHLTKFEIGRQLGFVGEDGFTNLSQNILVRTLVADGGLEKKGIRNLQNWEGTSDKYVRTIAQLA